MPYIRSGGKENGFPRNNIIIDSLDSTNLAYKGQEHAQFVETVLLKRIINGYKAIEDIHTQICTMLSGWYGNRHHWGT